MKIAIVSIFREGFGSGCGRVAHDMAEHFAKEHDYQLSECLSSTRASKRFISVNSPILLNPLRKCNIAS